MKREVFIHEHAIHLIFMSFVIWEVSEEFVPLCNKEENILLMRFFFKKKEI